MRIIINTDSNSITTDVLEVFVSPIKNTWIYSNIIFIKDCRIKFYERSSVYINKLILKL